MLVWPDVSHCAKKQSAKKNHSTPDKPQPCYREHPQTCKIDGFSGLERPLPRLDPAALTSALCRRKAHPIRFPLENSDGA